MDRKRNNLVYYQAHFCVTGHFLNWENSYAQDYKMRAAAAKLHGAKAGNFDKKKIERGPFN